MAKPTLAGLQAQLEDRDQTISERDATIIRLRQQIEALEAKSRRRPVPLQHASVQALPDLKTGILGTRVPCPLNGEHGEVTPNVHRKCPKCFTHCIWMNSEAGKRALVQAQLPAPS
jgi:hypothetical protein